MSKANVLTNHIIAHLYKKGVFAWRASSTGIYDRNKGHFRTAPKKGVSDILAVLPPTGKLVAIEVKIGKDRMSPEQTGFHKNVIRMGGEVFIAKDFELFKEWFDDLLSKIDNGM